MWTRAELKRKAKLALKRYYGAAIVVSLIASLFAGDLARMNMGSRAAMEQSESDEIESMMPSDENDIVGNFLPDSDVTFGIAMIAIVVILVIAIIAVLLGIFVGNPLIVGRNRFYLESMVKQKSVGVGSVLYGFGNGNYFNIVKTLFMKDVIVTLWTLLLIVPGIIKSYEYFMVPYILAENPDMNSKEARLLSREMTEGHKWEIFILNMSFFGWYILAGMFCVVGIFFVVPYTDATYAELYAVMRKSVQYQGLRGFGEVTDQTFESEVIE